MDIKGLAFSKEFSVNSSAFMIVLC